MNNLYFNQYNTITKNTQTDDLLLEICFKEEYNWKKKKKKAFVQLHFRATCNEKLQHLQPLWTSPASPAFAALACSCHSSSSRACTTIWLSAHLHDPGSHQQFLNLFPCCWCLGGLPETAHPLSHQHRPGLLCTCITLKCLKDEEKKWLFQIFTCSIPCSFLSLKIDLPAQ